MCCGNCLVAELGLLDDGLTLSFELSKVARIQGGGIESRQICHQMAKMGLHLVSFSNEPLTGGVWMVFLFFIFLKFSLV